MGTVQSILGQNYAVNQVLKPLNRNFVEKMPNRKDQYIGNSINIPEEEKSKKLTDEQAAIFAEKYDIQNMDRSQFTKLLAELRDASIITEQEFSIGYAGMLPDCGDGAPVWPEDTTQIDFLHLLTECAEYCKGAYADSTDGGNMANETLAKTYFNLSAAFVKISSKQESDNQVIDELLPADEASNTRGKDDLAAIYGSKAMELYELLKQDTSFVNNDMRHCTTNPVARELAKQILLSDDCTIETLAKEMWVYRAKENKFRAENNYMDMMYYLPKDYTGIADEIKGKLLCGNEKDVTEVLTAYEGFLSRKAKRERLTDVERILSGFAESHEKATWQSFDERMEPIQNLIEKDFQKAGYSFDVNKTYQFYLDTKTFTFSVTGGTEEENALIANAINTHPKESYKFDPLHTVLMALYSHRREDLSYNPWQIDFLPDLYKNDLLNKYGVATDVSADYTKKMKQFIAAYQMYEIESNIKLQCGFGMDELLYTNGRFTGKTERAMEYLAKIGDDSIIEMGYAYRNILSKYTGTPEFESAVFIFEDGKFKVTYGQ